MEVTLLVTVDESETALPAAILEDMTSPSFPAAALSFVVVQATSAELPEVAIAAGVEPLILATVGFGYVPERSPPAEVVLVMEALARSNRAERSSSQSDESVPVAWSTIRREIGLLTVTLTFDHQPRGRSQARRRSLAPFRCIGASNHLVPKRFRGGSRRAPDHCRLDLKDWHEGDRTVIVINIQPGIRIAPADKFPPPACRADFPAFAPPKRAINAFWDLILHTSTFLGQNHVHVVHRNIHAMAVRRPGAA